MSAELVTADLLALDDHGPDRPIVRIERAPGSWSEAVPIERGSSITLRTNRAGGRLRIDTDTGRYAGLATNLEIGPTVTHHPRRATNLTDGWIESPADQLRPRYRRGSHPFPPNTSGARRATFTMNGDLQCNEGDETAVLTLETTVGTPWGWTDWWIAKPVGVLTVLEYDRCAPLP